MKSNQIPSHTPPTGDLAHNLGMCPSWELNQWPFDSQADAQSTEPHQPGHNNYQLSNTYYVPDTVDT